MPVTIACFLHSEHDPVASIIHNVNMEQLLGWAGNFPEIKFPHQSVHLEVAGKLNILYYMQIHKKSIENNSQQFSCNIFVKWS
jgi:hypothetical protein